DEVASVGWDNNGGIVNGVNVLDLLTNNQLVELPFKPGAAFDRISVGIKTLVQASVFPPVHLYSVERCYDLEEPEYVAWKSYVIDGDATLTEVKGSEEVVYTIHVENTVDVDINDLLI